MKWPPTTPGVAILVFGTLLSTSALGTPVTQGEFNQVCKPKAGTALEKATCLSCHVKMADKKLNLFGMDVKAEMGKQKTKAFTAAVWAKIGAKDSDKDRVSNKAEVTKGSLPSDPKSK